MCARYRSARACVLGNATTLSASVVPVRGDRTLRRGAAFGGKARTPVAAKIVNSLVAITDVPFSSYVAYPRTPLHYVDARIKQAWLLALVYIIPRAPWQLKSGLVAATTLLALTCLPTRLCRAQLSKLLPLAALICAVTSVSASQAVPLVPSSHALPEMQDLPSIENLGGEYRYTLFKLAFLSVSRYSLGLGISAGAITFAVLQVTSIFLVTTPPEQMALSYKWFLTPLAYLGLPVERLTFSLLLALRFVSLVFDEVRNLALGLAARGVQWESMTRSSTIAIGIVVGKKLFGNLLLRSRFIAESLTARGIVAPGETHHRSHPHHLNVPILLPSNLMVNIMMLGGLIGCICFVWHRKVGL